MRDKGVESGRHWQSYRRCKSQSIESGPVYLVKIARNGVILSLKRYRSFICFVIVLFFVPKISFATVSSDLVWTGSCCGQSQPQFIHNPQALVDYFLTTPLPLEDPNASTYPAYTNCSSKPATVGQSCYVYAWSSYIDYHATRICPDSYTPSGSDCTLPPGTPDPQKNSDKPDMCAGTNPCNAGTGNKYQSEIDYVGSGAFPLKLERKYNSGGTTPSSVEMTVWGNQWRGSYDRSVSYATNGTISTATVKREGGKQYYFNLSGDSFVGDDDVVGTLLRIGVDASGNATGWAYTNEYDELESYDSLGKLVTITNRAGLVQTLVYSDGTTGTNGGYVLNDRGIATAMPLPAGLLIRVADPAGRTLQFGYDAMRRVVKMIDPAEGTYLYAYNGIFIPDHLISITYPDTKKKIYLYGETANVSATPNMGVSYTHALTGIIDENDVRYASWTYDAAGRATSSEHGALGSGIDHVDLVYTAPDVNGNSTTSVIDVMDVTRTYNFSTLQGVVKSTGIIGQPCNDCSAAVTYDANGNVSSRTDFKGNRTDYSYDLTRNLETSRTEGLTATGATTPATRTITTVWHATFRLPEQITNGNQQTTYAYNPQGDLTDTTVTDLATHTSRHWHTTYTYGSVPGVLLQKVEDGPRTDVSDLTIYDYYPADAACAGGHLGCRGQLKEITDALSHHTQLTRYSAHGQIEELIDPNELITTMTYDSRQRLTSLDVGGETTHYRYSPAGLLTRVTGPDNAYLEYGYDDAHRLTQTQDNLGNTFSYTLDAMGHRTEEQAYDPGGQLARSQSRVYDALSRLQNRIQAQ